MAKRTVEHLLVLPVPFRRSGADLLVEVQAHHGLERWLDSFETLLVAAPTMPEDLAAAERTMRWVRADDLQGRVELLPLPWGFGIFPFLRHLPAVIRVLDDAIARSRYLQFAISGLVGDWAGVGAEIALLRHRKYAVHTDNVAHEYILRALDPQTPWRVRARKRVVAGAMKVWHKSLIGHCSIGLFHGMDTFSAYAPWCRHGAVIHNIHDVYLKSQIADPARNLADKGAALRQAPTIAVAYFGRLAPDKAPLDWLRAVALARARGAPIRAQWAGDGPLREEFAKQIADLGAGDWVAAPGFIARHELVAQGLMDANIFLFTHVTPESPRCLIEALMMGTPIVGYDSAYARDLISKHRGGVLVPVGDWRALGNVLAALAADRDALADLTHRALQDGGQFTSHAVFAERSALIRAHLP